MHVLAQYAPALILVASGSGALVLCLLIYLYGFSLAAADGPRTAIRRLLVTRVGLALAAVCFAVTAVAAVLGPSQRPSGPSPALVATPAPPPPAGADAAKLRGAYDALDARLRALETSLREVGADARKTSVRIERLERLERAKPQVAQPTSRGPAPQVGAPPLVPPRGRAITRSEASARSDGPATWKDPLAPRAESTIPRDEQWTGSAPGSPLASPMRFTPEPEERSATTTVSRAPQARPNANHPLPPLERARDGVKQLGDEISDTLAAVGDRLRKALGRD